MSDDVKKPYKASYGHDGKYYVEGPAGGVYFDDSGKVTLYSSLRFDTEEEAKKAAIFANIGYAQGIKRAQLLMRVAIGL